VSDEPGVDGRKAEDEVAILLSALGLPRHIAITLSYVHKNVSAISLNIESGTSLRQPEVSMAVQWLRKRGWLKREALKRKTKGRPVHSYELAIPFLDIVAALEEDERVRAEKTKGTFARLKELA
jgi:predicted transcriptional regulator